MVHIKRINELFQSTTKSNTVNESFGSAVYNDIEEGCSLRLIVPFENKTFRETFDNIGIKYLIEDETNGIFIIKANDGNLYPVVSTTKFYAENGYDVKDSDECVGMDFLDCMPGGAEALERYMNTNCVACISSVEFNRDYKEKICSQNVKNVDGDFYLLFR